MSRLTILPFFAMALFLGSQTVHAHCQVPCGIYGDEGRFEALLEDATTISKATAQINELAGTHDAQGSNQLIRWVTTKEAHASNIQTVMCDYFLAQRIKTDDPKYVEKLTAAHKVIVAAMKTKQTADAGNAAALTKAIVAFHFAYDGHKAVTHAAAEGHSDASDNHAGHDHDAHGHGDHGDHSH